MAWQHIPEHVLSSRMSFLTRAWHEKEASKGKRSKNMFFTPLQWVIVASLFTRKEIRNPHLWPPLWHPRWQICIKNISRTFLEIISWTFHTHKKCVITRARKFRFKSECLLMLPKWLDSIGHHIYWFSTKSQQSINIYFRGIQGLHRRSDVFDFTSFSAEMAWIC